MLGDTSPRLSDQSQFAARNQASHSHRFREVEVPGLQLPLLVRVGHISHSHHILSVSPAPPHANVAGAAGRLLLLICVLLLCSLLLLLLLPPPLVLRRLPPSRPLLCRARLLLLRLPNCPPLRRLLLLLLGLLRRLPRLLLSRLLRQLCHSQRCVSPTRLLLHFYYKSGCRLLPCLRLRAQQASGHSQPGCLGSRLLNLLTAAVAARLRRAGGLQHAQPAWQLRRPACHRATGLACTCEAVRARVAH